MSVAIYLANTRAEQLSDELDEYASIRKKKSDPESDSASNVFLEESSPVLEPNVSILWKELYWKIICDDDEWRDQFYPIRNELTRCLQLEKIKLPEDKQTDEVSYHTFLV